MVKPKTEFKLPKKNLALHKTDGKLGKSLVAASTAGNMRVVVRVRPPSERELTKNFRNVVKVLDTESLIFDPKEDEEPFFYHGIQQRNWDITKRANKHLNFTFDRVFGCEACNLDVFEESTKGLIDNLMSGYNCSVFVYGATGAGKTYTMIGSEADPGITFQTVTKLFEQKDKLSSEREFEIAMSYLEVYNETVQDLLNPGPALQLRENGKYGVLVSGLEIYRIHEVETLFELLARGNRNRTQHPTDANAESSRSHAVFQVYLKMKVKTTGEVQCVKLSMIDLAGSERGAATGFSGARFTEGANINRSLLALGNCINSLADGLRHVPYRDSKLTRLLKDSLGGNCRTIMITNVSPSSLSFEDTYNTLKYATRAKKIKSNIMKNVVNNESNFKFYVKLSDELKKENEKLKLELSLLSQKTCNCNNSTEQKAAVEVASTTVVSTTVADDPFKATLKELYAKKIELLEKMRQHESADSLVLVRKNLKEECNSRISATCNNSTEKQEVHRRLDNVVDRLDRQNCNFQKSLHIFKERIDQLGSEIKQLLDKTPHLQQIADVEEAKISIMKSTYQFQNLQKVNEFHVKELGMRDELIQQLWDVLKPCFIQLKGRDCVTDALDANYQRIVRQLQGIRSVKWDNKIIETEEIYDVISTTTTTESSLNCTVTLDCKTVVECESDDASSIENVLNETYKKSEKLRKQLSTKVSVKTPLKEANKVSSTVTRKPTDTTSRQPISAKHIMTKLYKVSPSKKLRLPQSPRNKENKFLRPTPLGRARIHSNHKSKEIVHKARTASASPRTVSSVPRK